MSRPRIPQPSPEQISRALIDNVLVRPLEKANPWVTLPEQYQPNVTSLPPDPAPARQEAGTDYRWRNGTWEPSVVTWRGHNVLASWEDELDQQSFANVLSATIASNQDYYAMGLGVRYSDYPAIYSPEWVEQSERLRALGEEHRREVWARVPVARLRERWRPLFEDLKVDEEMDGLIWKPAPCATMPQT